jgi:hypothetical protein
MERGVTDPESASEITLDLVKKVLHNEPSVSKLVSIEIDSDFGSWGLLGDIARVKLNYAESECEPKTVIVKLQKVTNPEREGQIYQLILEAKIHSIPRLFGVFDNGTLVLEDMSPAKPLSAKNLTISQVSEVISILADINGKFVGDSRVPKNPIVHFVNVINHNIKESWHLFESRYRDQLVDVVADFEWMWKNSEAVSTQHNSEPTTLNHADIHLENLLFDMKGEKPILIDWHLAGQKVLPFDISGLLVNSLTVEQRRENEDKLLKKYYELLPNSVQRSYSFDRFLLDYRACVTKSMIGAVIAVGPRFDNRPDQMDNADIKASRVIAAVKDLKPVDAIQELVKRNL